MIQRSDKQKDKGHTVQNDDESIQCVLYVYVRVFCIFFFTVLTSVSGCFWICQKENIRQFLFDGCNMFRDNYQVYANDVETYASIIADSILNQADIDSASELVNSLAIEYTTTIKKLAKPIIDFVKKEQLALEQGDYERLITLYKLYPTVQDPVPIQWNASHCN